MPVTSANVSFRRSATTVGLINNLGGAIGAAIISQLVSAPSLISGVTIVSGSNNQVGIGQLSYAPGTNVLSWQPPNRPSVYGSTVPTNGTYVIGGVDGYITVTVVFASLPSIYRVESLAVSNNVNNVFNNVSPAMSLLGNTQYRCLYFQNNHPSLTAYDTRLFIKGQPDGPNVIAIGLDPAGTGNGTSTGVAQSIADELTAPTGVTFTQPLSASTGLVLGDLTPGQCRSFWQRRVVPANAFGMIEIVTATIGIALVG